MGSVFKSPVRNLFQTQVENQQIPTMTQEQSDLLRLLTQLAGQGVNVSPDQGLERSRELFEQAIGAPARQRFEEETLPQLLQRFASSGSLAGSPASQQAAVKGLSDLESRLAQAQGQFVLGREQQQQQLPLQLASLALGQRPFEAQQIRTPGIGSELLQLGAQALPFLFL